MTYTLITAGWLGIIAVVLAGYVGKVRGKHKVALGDGGNEEVLMAMRAHANFVEYAPLGLMIIAALEATGGNPTLVMTLGYMLVIGRILHGWGLNKSGGTTWQRGVGTLLSFLVLLVGGGFAIYNGYTMM